MPPGFGISPCPPNDAAIGFGASELALELREDCRAPRREVALENMPPRLADEPEVEAEVMDCGDLPPERFTGDSQVPEVGAGVRAC